jgi:hypothetical protein
MMPEHQASIPRANTFFKYDPGAAEFSRPRMASRMHEEALEQAFVVVFVVGLISCF